MKRRLACRATGAVAAAVLVSGGALSASASPMSPVAAPPAGPAHVRAAVPRPPVFDPPGPPENTPNGPGHGLCRLMPWLCD